MKNHLSGGRLVERCKCVQLCTQRKTPQTCSKLSVFYRLFATCQQFATTFSVSSICKKPENMACCNLSCTDLLPLVETTCSKLGDNKLSQSACNRLVVNKLPQAMRTHPDIDLSTDLMQLARFCRSW